MVSIAELGQREHLEDAILASDERALAEPVTRQKIRVDLHFEQLADPFIIIEADTMAIGNRNEKIIQQKLVLRKRCEWPTKDADGK